MSLTIVDLVISFKCFFNIFVVMSLGFVHILFLCFLAYIFVMIFVMYKVYNEYIYMKQKVSKTRSRTDVNRTETQKILYLLTPSPINTRTRNKDLKGMIITLNVLIRMYWGSIIAFIIFIIYSITMT